MVRILVLKKEADCFDINNKNDDVNKIWWSK